MKACEIAGVELRTEPLGDRNPIKLIWSNNVVRKVRSKGAIAIIAAKAFPEPAKVGRGQKVSATETFPMVSPGRLSEARTILHFAPELADQVLSNFMTLPDAYNEARRRKVEAERRVVVAL